MISYDICLSLTLLSMIVSSFGSWVIFHCVYVCAYDIFFIHSSVHRHLGCLHVLAIVNSAAMNLRHMYHFQLEFSLDIWQGAGLLIHLVVLLLVFWGTPMLFSTAAAPVYIPTNGYRTIPFSLHHLQHLSNWYEVISSVQLLSCVRLFATPWITACQASLSITNSRSLPKLTSIESLMPSSHLILCRLLLLLPPIPPSIRVFVID